MRMRKKPNLQPRMEKCAHLMVHDPKSLRGQWLHELPHKELHVELGCGKGRFTAETAEAAPDTLLVALEKSADAQIIAIERADNAALTNVRFMNVLVDYLPDYFAQDEVGRIYINFCDPWHSNSHRKRRLTHSGFLELYKRVLRPGGEIHFKTDNLPLFEFSLREFESCGFAATEVTRDLHANGPVGVMTDYELKFHTLGHPICRGVFTHGEA